MESSVDKIAPILGRRPIAKAVCRSISAGLNTSGVHLVKGTSEWDIFDASLQGAIRDIEEHDRGILLKRLIEFGPHDPGKRRVVRSDGKTLLSDPECELAVNFIFYHMVNRFKGELAELLAIEPCLLLMQRMRNENRLSSSTQLYWGDVIGERRRLSGAHNSFGAFTKGADGLLVNEQHRAVGSTLEVEAIVEVKSMRVAKKRLHRQLAHHRSRLRGGLRLADHEYAARQVECDRDHVTSIAVLPARWKLDRRSRYVKTDTGKHLEFWELDEPPVDTEYANLGARSREITLAWSEEAIEQAAFEMTYWYMSQVGEHIYSKKPLPKGWEAMTPLDAGYNAIKNALYYFPLRPLPESKARRAIKLYNVYGFGYPRGAESKGMLWPEDFSTYRITESVLDNLAAAGLPENTRRALRTLAHRSYSGAEAFQADLSKAIGEEAVKNHKPLLLELAECFPVVD